ncbi:kinase-like domain-containing protein [Gigaspora rosea]|uniref:Kinase-like domain-containing protein n=1 Tax=Gigaspora rosea TaxID=44941 RepID=A0A397V9K0_9GLOM|nr:kinase-like domain-containing protein [Gigaspora rosea]
MNNSTFIKIKQELKFLYNACHPNIIKFYGISRDPRTGNFMMVLQLANEKTLRMHLQAKRNNGLYKISWSELIKIAKDITIGLDFLHASDIFHQNLHSKNILINDGKALIADFGISKHLDDTTCLNTQGVIAYIDPLYFLHGKKFERNKKSDVYSLGILLWELTSGIPPFHNLSLMEIMSNIEENVIVNTSSDYVNLYDRCWSSNPDQRPTSNKILIELEKLSAKIGIEFIIDKISIDNQTILQDLDLIDNQDDKLNNIHRQSFPPRSLKLPNLISENDESPNEHSNVIKLEKSDSIKYFKYFKEAFKNDRTPKKLLDKFSYLRLFGLLGICLITLIIVINMPYAPFKVS